MFKIKYFIQQSWLLIVSSFCFGLLIAVTNAGLSPRIIQNKINKRNQLVKGLLLNAEKFIPVESEITIKSVDGRKTKVEIFKALAKSDECVGWSFNAAGPGFTDKIELVVAVDAKFEKIAGFDVLSSTETVGFGDKIKHDYFRDQFEGAPATALKLVSLGEPTEIDSKIVAISGATVSSEAVVEIVSNSVTQIKEQLQSNGVIGNGR